MKLSNIFLGFLIVLSLWLLFPHGCTNPNVAYRVLSQSGYTQIEITGYRFFMRGRDDFYVTGFRAQSPSGATVTGAVTSGFFKGSTIRFD